MTNKQPTLTQEEICPICLRHNSFDNLMCRDCIQAYFKGRQSMQDEVRKIKESLKSAEQCVSFCNPTYDRENKQCFNGCKNTFCMFNKNFEKELKQ
jgi:hypothetical protein